MSGHDFSRAVRAAKLSAALAAEGEEHEVSGHEFSRAVGVAKLSAALAAEG